MSVLNSTLCSLFSGDQTKCDAVLIVRWTSASFSLVGCIFIAAVIWLFKKYQVFAQRLILYLTIAAFLDSIGYLFGDIYVQGPVCKFEAFWLTYFEWVVLLWVSCITFNLYFTVIHIKRTDKYEWMYNIVCWGLPALMACLPFMGDYYGPAGAWCWIQQRYSYWRLGIWYGPLFIIILALFIMYTYIHIHIKHKVKAWEGTYSPEIERTKEVLKRDIKSLRLYPAIYLVLSIFPVINRIQNAINHDPVFALTVLHTLFSPLPGAINAIAFGLDSETMTRLSWAQIKAAIMSRFSDPAVIREYPCEVQNPVSEVTSDDVQQQYVNDNDKEMLVT